MGAGVTDTSRFPILPTKDNPRFLKAINWNLKQKKVKTVTRKTHRLSQGQISYKCLPPLLLLLKTLLSSHNVENLYLITKYEP